MSFQETLSDYQGFDFDRFFAGVSDADVARSLTHGNRLHIHHFVESRAVT